MTIPVGGVTYAPSAADQNMLASQTDPTLTGGSQGSGVSTDNGSGSTGSGSGAGASNGTSGSSGSDATSGSSSSSSATKPMLDPQAFLQLLVAQLQYQDPTNPVDTSSFLTQTATLTQVQSMQSMTDAITSLVNSQQSDSSSQSQSITAMADTLASLLQAQQTTTATSMIGKEVHYTAADGNGAVGVVDGVSLSNGVASLQIGQQQIPLSSVTAVDADTDPTSSTSPSTTPPTTDPSTDPTATTS